MWLSSISYRYNLIIGWHLRYPWQKIFIFNQKLTLLIKEGKV